jgi:hypothetical protein
MVGSAVFLPLGCVSAQAQVAADMRLRQNFAQRQKSSRRTATVFLEPL